MFLSNGARSGARHAQLSDLLVHRHSCMREEGPKLAPRNMTSPTRDVISAGDRVIVGYPRTRRATASN